MCKNKDIWSLASSCEEYYIFSIIPLLKIYSVKIPFHSTQHVIPANLTVGYAHVYFTHCV